MTGKRALSATELAHLLALAAKAAKVDARSPAELRRLLDGLTAMVIATAEG